jgi:hypothetical protein
MNEYRPTMRFSWMQCIVLDAMVAAAVMIPMAALMVDGLMLLMSRRYTSIGGKTDDLAAQNKLRVPNCRRFFRKIRPLFLSPTNQDSSFG